MFGFSIRLLTLQTRATGLQTVLGCEIHDLREQLAGKSFIEIPRFPYRSVGGSAIRTSDSEQLPCCMLCMKRQVFNLMGRVVRFSRLLRFWECEGL
jgi:hypothetical protein